MGQLSVFHTYNKDCNKSSHEELSSAGMLAGLQGLDAFPARKASMDARNAWVNTGRQTRLPLSVFYNKIYSAPGEPALEGLVTAFMLWACAALAVPGRSADDFIASNSFVSYNGFWAAIFSSSWVVLESLFGVYCSFSSMIVGSFSYYFRALLFFNF